MNRALIYTSIHKTRYWAALALVCVLFLPACSRPQTPKVDEQRHQMTGEIMALDSKLQTATVKHGPIDNWMEAMTMEYPVKSKAEFEQLHVGDHITATVSVHGTDYELTEIRKQTNSK